MFILSIMYRDYKLFTETLNLYFIISIIMVVEHFVLRKSNIVKYYELIKIENADMSSNK